MRTSAESSDIESIMQWFKEGIEDGENGILVYPNLQTFRQIYTQYVKDHLVAREGEEEQKEKGNDDDNNDSNNYSDNNNRSREQFLMPRIILIATFYDTICTVKHNLTAVGVEVQSRIDDGSLLIVDAFGGYYPKTDGMKKLVVSLSERARKEGRVGVTAIINTGFLFLYGRDIDNSNLMTYEASLPSKTDGGNVRGFSCYHARDYENLVDNQKKELLAQGQKKSLEITDSAAYVPIHA